MEKQAETLDWLEDEGSFEQQAKLKVDTVTLRAKTQLAFVLDVFKMDVPENSQGSPRHMLIVLIFYYHEKISKIFVFFFLNEQNI